MIVYFSLLLCLSQTLPTSPKKALHSSRPSSYMILISPPQPSHTSPKYSTHRLLCIYMVTIYILMSPNLLFLFSFFPLFFLSLRIHFSDLLTLVNHSLFVHAHSLSIFEMVCGSRIQYHVTFICTQRRDLQARTYPEVFCLLI